MVILFRMFLSAYQELGKVIKRTSTKKFLKDIQKGNGDKKLISKLYIIFSSMDQLSTDKTEMGGWSELSQENWTEVYTEAHLATNSNSVKEFKWN